MMRWYDLKLWDFFEELNQQHDCQYDYIMRMDEESYIHSGISYNLFDHMVSQGYEYAFQQCSYEMGSMGQVWTNYTKANPHVVPLQTFTSKRPCGFYNNFFIAKLAFFKSDPVQHFLTFVDQGGYMYRQRVNDLVLQTAAVYAFLPTEKIHRFLDFTYEHITLEKSGCPRWGGIQQGYEDPNGRETIMEWADRNVHQNKCPVQTPGVDFKVRVVELRADDLSPSYQHLPSSLQEKLVVLQVAAGLIDLQGKGLLSG